ncbi:MAG: serpin family protein [Mycobacterium sp.]
MYEHDETSEPINPVVRAANQLTARWCARLGGEDSLISAAGVWPLLALLASAADEPAQAELAAALGRPAAVARQDALELLDILRAGVSATAALGIWTRKDIPLHEEWASQLPEGVGGQLTDQAALDRWATKETGGLIDKFPLPITPDTALMLASALAARVCWGTPFDARPRNRDSGADDPAQQWLSRTTHSLGSAVVLDDSVTRIVVEGDVPVPDHLDEEVSAGDDIDVHLLLGNQHPSDVLATGLRELSGEAKVVSALYPDRVKGAPGLRVRREQSWDPNDQLYLKLPSFEIKAKHNLLDYADVFGLGAVTDPGASHLPLLSPVPLYISAGAQDVLARFFATGFEAAAVTAFGMRTGALPKEKFQVTTVDVTFDRPFGFLAVHRPSGLAVVAGWVSSPFQPTRGDEDVDLRVD